VLHLPSVHARVGVEYFVVGIVQRRQTVLGGSGVIRRIWPAKRTLGPG
jgi:hypothetical protein